jgi:hypothetical protein
MVGTVNVEMEYIETMPSLRVTLGRYIIYKNRNSNCHEKGNDAILLKLISTKSRTYDLAHRYIRLGEICCSEDTCVQKD